ncbi:MAG: hypothetical protein ABIT38_18395 [Gemmatimonadaceae bacterium]
MPARGRGRYSLAHGSRVAASTLLLLIALACGGGGGSNNGTPTQPSTPGTLALSVPAPAVSMGIGGTGSVSISIARGGSFTGSVSLAVTGLPSGVTASFAPSSLDASTTTSTLTLTAATSATAGTSTLTVTASESGVSTQNASVQLTIVQPVISLAESPAALSIAAGQSGTSTISITRSAGFAGAVTLALVAPPAGFTATFNSSPTNAATSSVTLAVASTVVTGQYTLTIKGSATGAQDKTVSIAVTVPAALPIGFSIVVDPVEFELPAGKGWSANGIVSVQRVAGFTAPVTVSVTSLGIAAFAAPSPNVIAAGETATNVLAITADGAAPGVYAGTVRVTAPGFAEQTAQVRVRVSLPSTGNIVWKFCNASRVPRFFAVKDGSGAWSHIVPDGPAAGTTATPTTFSFNVTQGKAGVAMVGLGEKTSASPLIQGHDWRVLYMTTQELVEQAALECVRWPGTNNRSAAGSITGYQSFDAVLPTVSNYALASAGSTGPLTTTLSLSNLQPGPFDLFVTRSNFNGGGFSPIATQSLILKRALDPATGGSLAALSFASDGVAPNVATLTFGNTNGESFSLAESFLTASGLNALFSAVAGYTLATRSWYGVPSTLLTATDLHQFVATTGTVTARRAVIGYEKSATSGNVDFGPSLTSPTFTAGVGGASPWIVRSSGTLSVDYVARASMYLRENLPDPRTMTLVATRGWLGGSNAYDVAVPDLAAATGFTAFWNFRRGASVKWTFTGGEGDAGGPYEVFCIQVGICPVKAVDGARFKSAQATGTVTVP